MSKKKPKQAGFDNSWAAWKDRLGIIAVVVALLLLIFFMFVDASINFQCGVTDFLQGKCNRFDREFVPWDKLEKERGKSSSLRRFEGYRIDGYTIALRPRMPVSS